MDAPFKSRFYSQLPIDVFVMGRKCTISQRGLCDVEVQVDDPVDAQVVANSVRTFVLRKWMSVEKGDKPIWLNKCDTPFESVNALKVFIHFFLEQPIGYRMLTFDRKRGFRAYEHRESAVNQAYLSWFSLKYAERARQGKFKYAIPCMGYFGDNRSFCRSSVLDLSGCCHVHRKAASKTLFNFYPWFEREGFPEFSDQVQAVNRPVPTLTQRNAKRLRRAQNAVNQAELMDVLLGGTDGDTLNREQISKIVGVDVAPGELGYRRIQSAIRKCQTVFVFWHWIKESQQYKCSYADSDAKVLLQMIERGDSECQQRHDLMLKRYLASTAEDLAHLEHCFAERRQELLNSDWPLDMHWSTIPESLRTDNFLNAWTKWLVHFKWSKQQMTSHVFRETLAKLECWGPKRSVAAIDYSIANGWRGIYEQK